ncbi:MAG: hypothetical protein RMK18_02175 [Armatimonadota bacterium]|nr:hypothetical protein [Armatimonadota bacterium]MCX7777249.1 hypothetical protein [Armatimonadota bacterium]MDW8024664.1 hypothetical protein [Armatimonadota bacterium]
MRRWGFMLMSVLLTSCMLGSAQPLHHYAFAADRVALKIAVAYVDDRTGYPDKALADVAQFMLTQALREIEGFEVISVDLIRDAMTALKLRPPLTDIEMCKLANELKVDWVIRAALEQATLDKRTNAVSVPMMAEAVSRDLEVIISRASAVGTYTAKGDLANPLVLYTALVNAINNSCSHAAGQLEYSAKVKGILLLPPMNNFIRTNIGIHQGLKVGAKLLVVSHGRPVAWAKVVDVNDDDCQAELMQVVLGKRLEPNMKVFVISNPAAHEAPTYAERIERELRRATRELFIAIVITFGALIATDVIK